MCANHAWVEAAGRFSGGAGSWSMFLLGDPSTWLSIVPRCPSVICLGQSPCLDQALRASSSQRRRPVLRFPRSSSSSGPRTGVRGRSNHARAVADPPWRSLVQLAQARLLRRADGTSPNTCVKPMATIAAPRLARKARLRRAHRLPVAPCIGVHTRRELWGRSHNAPKESFCGALVRLSSDRYNARVRMRWHRRLSTRTHGAR